MLFNKLAERQFKTVAKMSEWLLRHFAAETEQEHGFLIKTALLGFTLSAQEKAAAVFWQRYQSHLGESQSAFENDLSNRLLLARLGLL